MIGYKKVMNAELLQLALVVSLLRLNPESYLHLMNTGPEVHEIFLGQSSAYTQSHFHNLNNGMFGYIHPKTVDLYSIDTASMLMDLNALGRYCRFQDFQNVVITFIANTENLEPENLQSSTTSSNSNAIHVENMGVILSESQDAIEVTRNRPMANVDSVAEQSNGLVCVDTTGNQVGLGMSGTELTAEDMDLIEVLWKQDIDLGVSRDVFEGTAASGNDKVKQVEQLKYQELEKDKETDTDDSLSSLYNPWEGLAYSIDSETGEHIIPTSQPQNETIGKEVDEPEHFTLEDETFQQIAEELNRLPVEEAFRLFNNGALNLTDENDNCETLSSFPDVLLEDQEDLIQELKQFDDLLYKTCGNNEDNAEQTDVHPNMQNCWQDFTSTFPFMPIASDEFGPTSSLDTKSYLCESNSSLVEMPFDTQENLNNQYLGVLLHNASLGPPAPDLTDCTYPHSDTSDVGSAVATSLSTLANSTNPMSDGTIGVMYEQDFPEFMYPNNASIPTTTNQTELFLTDMLTDEGLESMEKAVSNETIRYSTHVDAKEKQIDTLSDSAVSLMGSDSVPSTPGVEWLDSCSDSSSHHNDQEISFNMELNHSLALSSELNRGLDPVDLSGTNHPLVAQKKYKFFGRQLQKFENRGSDIEDPHQPEQTIKNQEYLTVNDQAEISANNPHPYTSTSGEKNLEHDLEICSASSSGNIHEDGIPSSAHHNHTYHLPLDESNCSQKPIMRDKFKAYLEEQGERKTDESNARALKLPISVDEIINLPIDDFNKKVSNYELNEPQFALIRDIRRRGKNKVAARNCRKRKLDQIMDLEKELNLLRDEKSELKAERHRMLSFRQQAQDKYTQFYEYIMKGSSTAPAPHGPPDFASTSSQEFGSFSISGNSTREGDSSPKDNKGARMKRKANKK